MTARTSNGTGGGLWSATSTWSGGVVPQDGDSVTIATGDTVTFDVDQSAWSTGITSLTINGTLNWTTAASTTTYLFMGGNITVASGKKLWVGNSASDTIPLTSLATIRFPANSSKITGAGTANFYGAICPVNASQLTSPAILGATTITLADDMGLSAGDMIMVTAGWGVGTKGVITDGGYNLIYTVQSYNSGTKVVTLTTGLGLARVAGDKVARVNRPILLTRASLYDAVICDTTGGCTAQGIQLMYSRGFSGTGYTVQGGVTVRNNTAGIGYNLYGCTISGAVTSANNTYGIGYTLFGCTISGAVTSANNTYGIGYTLYGCIISGAVTSANNTYGIGQNLNGCTISGAVTSANNAYTIAYSYGLRISGNWSGVSDPIAFYRSTDIQCIRCAPASATFASEYNNTTYVSDPSQRVESFDHLAVDGAYWAGMLGGTIASQATTTYLSHATALKFSPASSIYPVTRDYSVYFPAGRKLRFQIPVQKDFSGGTVVLQIIDPTSDPLKISTGAALVTTTKTDVINTWEVLEIAYSSTYARQLILRLSVLNASGNAHFDTTWLENRFCGILPVIGTPIIQSRSDES